MTEIIDFKDFNVASVAATTLFDGRTIGLCYDSLPYVKLTTPPMVAPFQVSEYTNKGRKTFSLSMAFNGLGQSCDLETMKQLFEALDDLLIELAIKHSSTWFKRTLTRQQIQNMYKPILKPSKDPSKYPPSLRIKLLQRDNQVVSRTHFVKTSGSTSEFDLRDFVPGSKVSAHIKLSNIWVVNDTFGVSLEGEDLFVHEPKLQPQVRYAFCDE
jgi:hypothetical protein